MSTRIGEIGGSQSLHAEYDLSPEGSAQRRTGHLDPRQNTIQRADRNDTSAIASSAARDAVPELAAGLLSILGGLPRGAPNGVAGSVQDLGELLGFILNVASLLQGQEKAGAADGCGKKLALMGREAMRQAGCDDDGAVTGLIRGTEVSGSFDERAGWRIEGRGCATGALGTAEGHYEAAAEARVAGQGSVQVGLAGASAQGSLYAGVRAEAEADGHLESASLATIGKYDVTLRADGRAEAEAGAYATAQGEAIISYAPPAAAVECDAGAFAGARAGVDASVGAGPVTAKSCVEGWAGVGAEAKLNAGFHDGKLSLDYGAGLAVGLGCSYSGSIEIDVIGTLKGIGGVAGLVAGKKFEALFDGLVDLALADGGESVAHALAAAPQRPTRAAPSPLEQFDRADDVEDADEDEDERSQLA